jgi:tricorn protease
MDKFITAICCASLLSVPVGGKEKITLAAVPALSPDGAKLVFNWAGDLWTVDSMGGEARPLTRHPASDHWPEYSPDGKELVFQSQRNGYKQLFIMPADGGDPTPVSWHTEGLTAQDWFPDGNHILATGWRDHSGLFAERLFKIKVRERVAEELLFDAYAREATVSPDGRQILFVREGNSLYRKGYAGSKAAQIWLYNIDGKTFTLQQKQAGGCRTPLWRPDGKGFYFVGAASGCFNIWECEIATGSLRQRTFFEDASVTLPGISRNGEIMVFRHLFDFYRLELQGDDVPFKLEIWADGDDTRKQTRRRYYNTVWNNTNWGSLDWTPDGLEMCFTTGGDLWVMDTVLKEPRLVCGETATHETDAVWAPDRSCIYFLRDEGHRANIWRATRKDPGKYWWQNRHFELEQLTDSDSSKTQLTVSPDGKKLVYAENKMQLMIRDTEGSSPRKLYAAVDRPFYNWSPDSQWLVASFKDSYDNWDVWILPIDASRAPYNVSRHPDYDAGGCWSPDGRKIAFVGERGKGRELDLFYVHLRKEDHEAGKHERSLNEAIEAMKSVPLAKADPPKQNGKEGEPKAPAKPPEESRDPGTVRIDFDGLFERVQRIKVNGSKESTPFWSHDSNALAFRSKINGKNGTYKVVFPNNLTPTFMCDAFGYYARWIEKDNKILWLVNGVPASYTTKHPFKVYQETDLVAYQRLAFRQIWRSLKDSFYDARLNNRDWEAMRLKYEEAAAKAPDSAGFVRVVSMLEGELNASHTGFRPGDKFWPPYKHGEGWSIRTAHLGLRFDPQHPGPGLKVHDVLPNGPTDHAKSLVKAGEIVTSIDGVDVHPGDDLTQVLNGPYERDILLEVRNKKGRPRDVLVRPIGYSDARDLVKEAWVDHNHRLVDTQSKGTFAYVHVDRMLWPEFERFEREIFALGYGKEGMVIDVRNNSGGLTADHLLMILNRNLHAYTIPRGGGVSYPRGYLAFTAWDKPIVVLCNQNTGSNGEIFSHAIKTLKRGKLVGVPTLGGVISMPTKDILDLGKLSIPRRGWFVGDSGEDMELNGALPDHLLWPHPGDIPAGKDEQLEKAINVLKADVAAWQARKRPPLIRNSERN